MSEHNDDKNNSVFKIALNLMVACLISGCIIAVTYFATADTAEKASQEALNKTMQTMIEGSTGMKGIEGKDGWYEVDKGNDLIGYIVPSDTKGYGGTIKLLVAVAPDLTVLTYKIISSNETPGLGDNAKKEPFTSQFTGKTEEHLIVTKDTSDTEDIVAMSGATISSKAVTKGVYNAEEELKAYLTGGQ
jgi:Na+-translocating ferredoxin:NAD+ oxidoreductase subunit G